MSHLFSFFFLMIRIERYTIREVSKLFSHSLLDIISFRLDYCYPPLKFIDPTLESYTWMQKYSIFVNFHLRSNFQKLKVVPLNLIIGSLHNIQYISMRLRLLDVVWIDLCENLDFCPKLTKTTLWTICFRYFNVFKDVLVDELLALTWLYGSLKHM